jgi:hypothetical protein
MARPRPTIDDEPEVYSQAWIELIHRKANRELRQRQQQQVTSFKPLLSSGYAVQGINLFRDDDRIAISMSTEKGTVTLVLDRIQADTLHNGLSRLLDHSCHQCP